MLKDTSLTTPTARTDIADVTRALHKVETTLMSNTLPRHELKVDDRPAEQY